jgi:hypothetical protein
MRQAVWKGPFHFLPSVDRTRQKVPAGPLRRPGKSKRGGAARRTAPPRHVSGETLQGTTKDPDPAYKEGMPCWF